MANNRGPMHHCTHTNDQHYGQTGCHACDEDFERHHREQEQAKRQAKKEREESKEKAK